MLHEYIRLLKKTKKSLRNGKVMTNGYAAPCLEKLINNAGSTTRFATVAVIKVKEVSHPNACVPPKELKQKITKPAMSTIEV